jgi:hypothetical protein
MSCREKPDGGEYGSGEEQRIALQFQPPTPPSLHGEVHELPSVGTFDASLQMASVSSDRRAQVLARSNARRSELWDRASASVASTIRDGRNGHQVTVSRRSSIRVSRFRPISDPGTSVDFANARVKNDLMNRSDGRNPRRILHSGHKSFDYNNLSL